MASLTLGVLATVWKSCFFGSNEAIIFSKNDVDADGVSKVMNALNVSQVSIDPAPAFCGGSTVMDFVLGSFEIGMLLFVVTGIIFCFYRLYCRWLGITLAP